MKHRSRRILLLLALLLLVAGATSSVVACVATPDDLGLREGRLQPCPDSPNCVCSEEPGAPGAIEPLAYTGDGPTAFAELVELLSSEPRVELVRVEAGYVHAIFRTPWLRFRDDLELRLDEVTRRVHVRSASRVGYSDLGANRRRVEALRARWRATGQAGPAER